MKKTRLNKLLRSALFSGLAMVGAMETASAGAYVGSLDPAFGAAFPDLGWRATFELTVPTACESAAAGQSLNASTFGSFTGCSGITVQNTELFFYNIADPDKTTVQSFLLGNYLTASDPLSTLFTEDQSLIGITFDATGKVTDFSTSASLRQFAGVADVPLGTDFYYFSLSISTNPSDAKLFLMPTIGQPIPDGSISEIDPVVTFASVPEPGSIALSLLALAGLGWTARRKRR